MQFMSHRAWAARLLATTVFVVAAAQIAVPVHAQSIGQQPGSDMELLPTGVFISPTAIPGSTRQLLNPQLPAYPDFAADEAVKAALSPDGSTLAILTAGYNSLNLPTGTPDPTAFTQYLFLYDVSGANRANPHLAQVIKQNNGFVGLVWGGNTTLYASGGLDDKVYVYTRAGDAPSAPFTASSIALGHKQGIGVGINVGNTGGLAVSRDGKTLVVANNYNDSITVIDTASNTIVADYDLRPFNTSGQDGVAGGEYPWTVVMKADGKAFISSDRDREVVVVDVSTPAAPKFVTRIALAGNALGMTLSADDSTLFVAEENADQVAVVDAARFRVVNRIDTRAPQGVLGGRGAGPRYTGADPVNVTVSPDGNTLYVVNNGSNSVAVIPLAGRDAATVTGLIPTGYAPKDVTFSADGSHMYIINGKSNTGPNPDFGSGSVAATAVSGPASNTRQFQLEQSSLVAAPVPTGRVLDELTRQVEKNNLYTVKPPENDARVMNFLREKIKHVIFVVKENRTYDQILGDLTNGSEGDPSLTQFGAAITPNSHALATNFVTIDNFMDAGDGSTDGWSWVMRSGVTAHEELSQQIEYAGRAFAEVCCGANNGVTVDLPTTAERDAATGNQFSTATAGLPGGTANVMPGQNNVGAMDAPFGFQKSYIWEAAVNAGRSVRSYGFQMVNNIGPETDANGTPIADPFSAGAVQVSVTNETLSQQGRTDLFFRGIDLTYPDFWRFQEWNREFQAFDANGQLPAFEMIRLGGDHMGSFAQEIAGVNTPEREVADNDLATGKLIEAVAHSHRYANNTLVIVVEDDAQDGADHVDTHRSPTYVVGPYVKQGAVVHTFYTLVSALRTIEDVLGTEHMNLNTAYARPMADVFDIGSSGVWSFNAVASTVLQGTSLQVTLNEAGVRYAEGPVVKSTHDVAYWDAATRGFDFSDADRVPPALFNRVLWAGLMGDRPYPVLHSAYQPVLGRHDDDDDDDK